MWGWNMTSPQQQAQTVLVLFYVTVSPLVLITSSLTVGYGMTVFGLLPSCVRQLLIGLLLMVDLAILVTYVGIWDAAWPSQFTSSWYYILPVMIITMVITMFAAWSFTTRIWFFVRWVKYLGCRAAVLGPWVFKLKADKNSRFVAGPAAPGKFIVLVKTGRWASINGSTPFILPFEPTEIQFYGKTKRHDFKPSSRVKEGSREIIVFSNWKSILYTLLTQSEKQEYTLE